MSYYYNHIFLNDLFINTNLKDKDKKMFNKTNGCSELGVFND